MATQITATLPTLAFPKEVDYPTQEDWTAFSAAAELNFGILGGSWSTQMQLWKTQANAMSTELNTNATDAQNARDEAVSAIAILSSGAIDDTTIANNKAYSNQKTNDLLGQKVDKNISSYAEKTTPVDADLIPLSDSASSFGIKKLTWANIKATLKTYFDTLYTVASSETTSGIIELATTAETRDGADDTRAITPLKLKNSVIGLGQTWQDVTTSRAIGTTYTNSSGKPIEIIISIGITNTVNDKFFNVNGVLIGTISGSTTNGNDIWTFIVPNGATYSLGGSNYNITRWFELR